MLFRYFPDMADMDVLEYFKGSTWAVPHRRYFKKDSRPLRGSHGFIKRTVWIRERPKIPTPLEAPSRGSVKKPGNVEYTFFCCCFNLKIPEEVTLARKRHTPFKYFHDYELPGIVPFGLRRDTDVGISGREAVLARENGIHRESPFFKWISVASHPSKDG